MSMKYFAALSVSAGLSVAVVAPVALAQKAPDTKGAQSLPLAPMSVAMSDCWQVVDRAKAVAGCTILIKDAGKDPSKLAQAYAARALALDELGKGKDALFDLTQALIAEPQNAMLWRRRGDVRAKLKQRIRSAADYSVAIKNDPNNVAALIGRGDQYRLLGILPKAVEDATAALKLDPDNVTAMANRAYALMRHGKEADALVDAEAALKLDPKATQALLTRGLINMKADPSSAKADLSKALEIDPASMIAKDALKRISG